uniref:NADH-ubiquinone oxidoreductase chain 6 n=1 Tax=Candida metapsilosis TaxID=273372 RepID=Q56E69_9ASCO|nr:NADH dehydrogenase subunit 6 [Candida metapsilosis]AAX73035.1 NADH dehydrogenase subunit 6 [Candida metapsilosis]ACB37041.1 NADH dehydrogenase subunit 6 [Candida metapsilosis]AEX57358.1 NADH dehydrogenase subunit 6 [Candida metapsilosis]AEX57373.1 NADH dehydrogenase subunit 6 [Candida metapsilosis]AEX57388.1 NADH dehydrogenase subunit 6 [Candida metapsilosis]
MFLISGISSILAIGLLSPVQSIVCLIVLFVSAAISLYSNGFVLMGILYVLIYVGAIAILFLFILSLLNIEYNYKGTIHPLILTILLICLIPLDLSYETYGIVENVNIAYPFNGLLDWDLELTTVGSLLYTEYAIPMILIGLILILSVIGAIAITK